MIEYYMIKHLILLKSLLIKRLLNRNKGTENNSKNKEFADELRKPIIRKFEKEKVHSSFIDNI